MNVSQNVSLSFQGVEEMSMEEKILIKNIEIAQRNLDEEVNGFKKVDKNLLKWITRLTTDEHHKVDDNRENDTFPKRSRQREHNG